MAVSEDVIKQLEKAERRAAKKLKDVEVGDDDGMVDFVYHVIALAAIKFTKTTLLEDQ